MDDSPKIVFDNIVMKAGLNSVNLATTYHGGPPFRGGFFLPHNLKRRLYIPEAGVVYFKPEPELYRNTKLKPVPSAQLHGYDALKDATEEAEKRGVGVSSWTICSRNEKLAAENPECATENIFGVKDPTWLCPNNPDSREYLLALIEDVTSNHPVEALELESLGFGTVMPPPRGLATDHTTNRLLTLCFCEACRSAARDMGYDWDDMTTAAKAVMGLYVNLDPDASDAIARGTASTTGFAEIASQMPGLKRFVEFQIQTVARCLKEIRERARRGRTVKIAFPMDFSLPLRSLAVTVDNFMASAQTAQELRHQAAVLRLIAPSAGIQTALSLLPGAHNLTPAMVAAVKSIKADTVNFYNYGNMHADGFSRINAALVPLRAQLQRR